MYQLQLNAFALSQIAGPDTSLFDTPSILQEARALPAPQDFRYVLFAIKTLAQRAAVLANSTYRKSSGTLRDVVTHKYTWSRRTASSAPSPCTRTTPR